MLLADGNGVAVEEIVAPTIAPTTAPAVVVTPEVVVDVVKESGASADVVASGGLFQSPLFWIAVAIVGILVVVYIVRKIINK